MKTEYWIIDTGAGGSNLGTFEARGPFKNIAAAEKEILRENIELHEISCGCTRRDNDSVPWCDKYHILKVIKTVQPILKSVATLETI